MSPFDFIKSITTTKENLITTDRDEHEYEPFIVNRGLSYFPDTLFYAQEMNINSGVDKKMQYDYLLKSIRKAKRFSKWAKKKEGDDVQAVMTFFGYSRRRAEEALNILTSDQVENIKNRLKAI